MGVNNNYHNNNSSSSSSNLHLTLSIPASAFTSEPASATGSVFTNLSYASSYAFPGSGDEASPPPSSGTTFGLLPEDLTTLSGGGGSSRPMSLLSISSSRSSGEPSTATAGVNELGVDHNNSVFLGAAVGSTDMTVVDSNYEGTMHLDPSQLQFSSSLAPAQTLQQYTTTMVPTPSPPQLPQQEVEGGVPASIPTMRDSDKSILATASLIASNPRASMTMRYPSSSFTPAPPPKRPRLSTSSKNEPTASASVPSPISSSHSHSSSYTSSSSEDDGALSSFGSASSSHNRRPRVLSTASSADPTTIVTPTGQVIPRAYMRPNAIRSSQACIACRHRKVKCVVPLNAGPDLSTGPSSGAAFVYSGRRRGKAAGANKEQGTLGAKSCQRCTKMGLDCMWAEEKRGRSGAGHSRNGSAASSVGAGEGEEGAGATTHGNANGKEKVARGPPKDGARTTAGMKATGRNIPEGFEFELFSSSASGIVKRREALSKRPSISTTNGFSFPSVPAPALNMTPAVASYVPYPNNANANSNLVHQQQLYYDQQQQQYFQVPYQQQQQTPQFATNQLAPSTMLNPSLSYEDFRAMQVAAATNVVAMDAVMGSHGSSVGTGSAS